VNTLYDSERSWLREFSTPSTVKAFWTKKGSFVAKSVLISQQREQRTAQQQKTVILSLIPRLAHDTSILPIRKHRRSPSLFPTT
jgi:hypothetical protein